MFRVVNLFAFQIEASFPRMIGVGVWKKFSVFVFMLAFFQAHLASAFPILIGFWRPTGPAPTPMVMSWNTNYVSVGSSAANQAQLPLAAGSTYNFTVYWGDGANNTITSWSDVGALHTYASAGAYTITLIGQVDSLYFNGAGDREKIQDISAWGNNSWKSMASAFNGCTYLTISASDSPNLKSVTDMSYMFNAALAFDSNINAWDTSFVTNMSYLFGGASAFNQSLNSWNTGSVTNMSGMFSSAVAFNGNIGSWNTAAVTNMSNMFSGATAFNQSLNSWNTGAVTNMYGIFQGASAFNGNITSWNTSAVTDMTYMFYGATVFNQNISSWNTVKVTNMFSMFRLAIAFNQNIGTSGSSWNTGAVTDMYRMFYGATAFNGNISNWNTAAVANMNSMFQNATTFNQNLSGWNVTAVGTSYINYRTGATSWTAGRYPPGFP